MTKVLIFTDDQKKLQKSAFVTKNLKIKVDFFAFYAYITSIRIKVVTKNLKSVLIKTKKSYK